MAKTSQSTLDDGTTFRGFLIGLCLGAIYTLFRVGQTGRDLRKSLAGRGIKQASSVESSLEAGKLTARERLEKGK